MSFIDILRTILTDGFLCSLIALGVFLTFRLLDFADMTAEGSILIGGAFCALMIKKGMPPVIGTFGGILGGAVCGFLTGFLNRVLKVPKLLSGIITLTASASIAVVILSIANNKWPSTIVAIGDNSAIFSFMDPLIFKGWQRVIMFGAIALVVMVIAYFFFGTEYGMAIRATGINERMAKSQGINTTMTTILCVVISNAIIGLAGALLAQRKTSGFGVTSATGYLIVGLASILIGEAVFGKRSFKNCLISITLGSILYFTIYSVTSEVFHVPTELDKLIYAILIVIALCLPMIKDGIRKLFARRKEVDGNVRT